MSTDAAAYRREYRQRYPDVEDRGRRAREAYRRALVALRGRHPAEFEELVNAERAAVGIPPVGTVKRGPKPKTAAA